YRRPSCRERPALAPPLVPEPAREAWRAERRKQPRAAGPQSTIRDSSSIRYGVPALIFLKYSRIARRSSALRPRSSSQVGSRNLAAARPVVFVFVGRSSLPPFADVASR